jgi:phosphohistidine phosphatase SixA
MKVIVMRHGLKDDTPPVGRGSNAPLEAEDEQTKQWRQENASKLEDALRPLKAEGRRQLLQKSKSFTHLESKPQAYFTSKYTHAWETGVLLATTLGEEPARVQTLWTLTPYSHPKDAPLTFNDIVSELGAAQSDLSALDVVVFIGHEARLSQLLESLTSRPHRWLEFGEAVRVEGSFATCLAGKARVSPWS